MCIEILCYKYNFIFFNREFRWQVYFTIPWHTHVCRWSSGTEF